MISVPFRTSSLSERKICWGEPPPPVPKTSANEALSVSLLLQGRAEVWDEGKVCRERERSWKELTSTVCDPLEVDLAKEPLVGDDFRSVSFNVNKVPREILASA